MNFNYKNKSSQPAIFCTLGLSQNTRQRLEELSGSIPTVGYIVGANPLGAWGASGDLPAVESMRPTFLTTTWRAQTAAGWQHLADLLWVDIDCRDDLPRAFEAARKARDALLRHGVPLDACSLFATGGKGFHIALPTALFFVGANARLVNAFPVLAKLTVLALLADVECLDAGIYNGGRGRLIRQANTRRADGAYKVPMAWDALHGLTESSYRQLCSAPGDWIEPAPASLCVPTAGIWKEQYDSLVFAEAQQRANPPLRANKGPTYSELGRLKAALRAIDAEPRENWLAVGMALHSTGWRIAFDLWDDWAKTMRGSGRFKPGACRVTWDAFKPGRGISLGSVFHLAKAGGK